MKLKLSICTIFLLFVTACSAPAAQPTSTPVDIPAIQTAAVGTAMANVTETAVAFVPPTEEPTATLAFTSTPNIIDTPTITVTPTENACDQMVFVSDTTYPDNTEVAPGTSFVKTWKVRNIGACSWKTNYTIIYGWGDKMSGQTTPITAEILPGSEGDISITLTAPLPLGTYKSWWRLVNNNGVTFGTPLTVVIIVK